ncbi:ATP-dependent zinc metalloprotease FtsH [Candidatus Falkowbacteria bacterium]|nr:ATP-dependent zinc metalloprotease FtsH [Candidatus Falkowbacteria bacterium]
MKNIFKNFIIFFVIFVLIAGVFSIYNSPTRKAENVSLDVMVEKIQKGEVEKIEIEGEKIVAFLGNEEMNISYKEPGQSLTEVLTDYGLRADELKNIKIDIKTTTGFGFWFGSLAPFLIPLVIIVVFILFMARGIQGSNNRAMMFGQSTAREINNKKEKGKRKKRTTTFKNVAGVKEAKEELLEIVDFLRFPKKFLDMGAKIPKGVLLLGPPGCGKTLLARAVAGEANVPFFHISGSEFVEMFVGVGASRVRDLFSKAKKSAPAIVFIDEIDAVGRQRGAGLGGSHDEREQTLNQILVEMDGFDINTNVIVVAATNRPDVLDPALLRPGRFDRRVVLDVPDINDREEILKIHAKGKPLVKGTSLRAVAERTPGFSGADLENLLNEAAILTVRRDKKQVGMQEILESVEKVILGPERKSHILNKKEKEITAYHEAGHAVVAHFLPNCDPIRKISIISRGQAAGFTLKLPDEDKKLHTKSEFTDDISSLLGGWVTEKEIFGEVTTGATSDLKKATELARKLVTQYGMSELGPQTFGDKDELVFLGREIHDQRNYSEKIAEQIDKEVARFIGEARRKAEEVVEKQKAKVKLVAETLLEKETLERESFEKLVK